jgi:hypothetical protein
MNEDCSHHLTTSLIVDIVEQLNPLVQEDRSITVIDVANKMNISCGSAYSNIHKDLGYHKICARWVPKQLKDEHKWAHMETCMQFLQQYCEGEAFLQWILLGNETLMHHYEPVSKC